jgi:hypothetical protein
MKKHSLCVFGDDSGDSSVDQLRRLLNQPEYSGPGTLIRVSRSGSNFYLNVIGVEGEDPGDINDSHLCPGSPGC